MPRYYVQSGSFRRVIQADSDRKAAVSAVKLAIQQVVPLDEVSGQAVSDHSSTKKRDAYAVMSGRLFVSEAGFESPDALELPTKEVITEWNRMLTTLDRLERMLDSAV